MLAGPHDFFGPFVARKVMGSNTRPGRIYIFKRGCAYVGIKTAQKAWRAYYKETLNHWLRVGHILDFGIPSVAILP